VEEEEINVLISTIKNGPPWSMYFAFRAIHDNTQTPVVGRVLAQVQPWWLENTYVVQVLHPFISDRAKAGEKMSFGNLLSGFDEHRTKNLEALLRQLNREELRPLSDELSSHAVSVIDHSFLNSFGRIWTAGDVSDSVYENPALMLHVEKIKDTLLKTPNRSVLLVGERGVGKTSLIKRVGFWGSQLAFLPEFCGTLLWFLPVGWTASQENCRLQDCTDVLYIIEFL
jgi:hypothetical protein